MTTFNVGTIDINNKKLETIIKTTNVNVDDIKLLFVNFLENELVSKKNTKISKKKGKWAKVADEIKDTMSESTSKYLQELECSQFSRHFLIQ